MGGILQAFAGCTVEEYRGAVAGRSSATARHPTLGRAVPRVRLPADGRAAALPGGQRLHLLHRLRRRPRLHAAGQPRRSTASRRSGSSAAPTRCVPGGDDGGALVYLARAGRLRRRPGQAGAHLEPHRPPPDPRRRQLERRHPDARFAAGPTRPALRLLVLHDDAEREFDYTAGAETALERAQARAAGPSSASRTTGRPSSPTDARVTTERSAPASTSRRGCAATTVRGLRRTSWAAFVRQRRVPAARAHFAIASMVFLEYVARGAAAFAAAPSRRSTTIRSSSPAGWRAWPVRSSGPCDAGRRRLLADGDQPEGRGRVPSPASW